VTSVRDAFRVLVVVAPPLAGLFAWKLCRDLGRAYPFEEFAAGGEPPAGPNEPRDDEGGLTLGRVARVGAAAAAAAGGLGAAGGYALGRRRSRTIRIKRPPPPA
jgi:hypothetical protein